MTSKHTPGPWHCGKVNSTHVYNDDGWLIASSYNTSFDAFGEPLPDPERYEEYEANARLIAAAPHMLETLRGILARASGAPHDDPELAAREFERIMRMARDAIAEAEGQS